MLFSSLPFLYDFLPAMLILYFALPNRLKNGALLLGSLLFYGWGEPKYLLLMALTILIFYFCGRWIGAAKSPGGKKTAFVLGTALGISLLAVFKYGDFFLQSLNGAFGMKIPLLRLALPVGISFYTFQCISYAADVYRGDAAPQKNIVSFGAYVTMFPQLIAGPIVRYADVEAALNSRRHTWEDFALGLRRFLVGLGKKVLLANPLGALTESYRASPEKTVLFAWLYAAAFTLQIYFDFSGYSDMATGLGRIFGFRFPENFRYPYLSGSVTEFWRRWHISLGAWFRDYVYIPLGGSRAGRLRWVRNILAVWILTGLWHGASWNFAAWGLLFALLLMIEKWIPRLKSLPYGLSHVYVLLAVTLSFVLFNAGSLSQAAEDYRGLFGGLPLLSVESVYYLKSNTALLLLGFLGATPLPSRWARGLSRRLQGLWAVLEPAGLLALLALCTACLVDGSFNPFLYFRF